MLKKVIGIVVVLAIVFTFVACNGDLAKYKTEAKEAIDAHVATLNADNYTSENWVLVRQKAMEGKAAVDSTMNKNEVNTAKAMAITAIDSVLQTEEGVIQGQAKQTYLDKVLKAKNSNATIDDVSFSPFLGIYNGSLVAIFYGGQYHGVFTEVEDSYELEGLVFAFSRGYPILVWNDGDIYELPDACEQGLLIKENLSTIHNLYYNIG